MNYADVKRRMDETMDKFLASIGYDGDIVWPVLKGNDVVLMAFVERRIRWAQPGDRVHVKGGGYVERGERTGWTHWTYYPDDPADLRDPARRPLTGRWLSGSPAQPQEQPVSDLPQIPA